MVNDVLTNGNRFYLPPARDAFMPIEFGAAAYRFGHSMVRPSYRANFTSGTGDSPSPTADPFFALVFDQLRPISRGPSSTTVTIFWAASRSPPLYRMADLF